LTIVGAIATDAPCDVDYTVNTTMRRYKGSTSFKIIERDFPHIVEMLVPLGGFGKDLDAMYDWHRARGIEDRHGRGRRVEGRDIVSWCFAAERRLNDAAWLIDRCAYFQKQICIL
jgi:hypothetical protein